ncbi:MAG TPA: oxidoreductase [Polyangiales bacterium]|nr:oxidoreductase [Polyangiales bacterium]
MNELRRTAEIRVGVVGFGYAAETFHVPLLRATEGYRITMVASRRGALLADALPGVVVVPDPLQLVGHPEVDLVVIASPNDSHAQLAAAALQANRHVVVDKPFTVTLAEARQLAAAASRSGRVLSVFHNRRWDSDFLTVQRAVREGLLGRVAVLESRIDRFRPQVRDRWREGGGRGAGLLYDLGPHLIDQALVLFGAPDRVCATLAQQRAGGQSTDFVQVVLRYSERVVTLGASMLVSGGTARFVVHGERASLVKQKMDIQEEQLRGGMLPGATSWGSDPDPAVLHDGATGHARTLPALPGDQREYYRSLRDAIHGRAPNPVPPAQACTCMAVLDAALRSAAEGRVVTPELAEEERAAWALPP